MGLMVTAGRQRDTGSEGGNARPVLEAAGVVKTYRRGVWPRRRSVRVLTGADVALMPGQVVGLIGENGSGKSTLMKILVGTLDRDGGTVTRRGRIGYCPQEPILYERLTCDEHFDFFGHAYGMEAPAMERAREALYDALNFGEYSGARVEELSGGTRSKLNLALALLPDPDVLMLDEPYAGFDWETYQRFWGLVAEHKREGRSVLIISHFVTDEDRFDRILQVQEGRTAER